MPEVPILSPTAASLSVEHLNVPRDLRWSDVQPGLAPDRLRADLRIQVCGKEVRFPAVHYGFGFEEASTTSLKAILQGLTALAHQEPHAWRAGMTGVPTHVLQLDSDPAERFELFIFDDAHLYLTYHTNRGGALALDLLVSPLELLAAEEALTRELVALLDAHPLGPDDEAARSRYLGRWERLKHRLQPLTGRLNTLLPPFDPPAY